MSKKTPAAANSAGAATSHPANVADARARERNDILGILLEDNPSPRLAAEVRIYADAFLEYCIAQANIDEHGTVVQHPRTGAPIDNPYIRTRDVASSKMLRIKLRTDRLWATRR